MDLMPVRNHEGRVKFRAGMDLRVGYSRCGSAVGAGAP